MRHRPWRLVPGFLALTWVLAGAACLAAAAPARSGAVPATSAGRSATAGAASSGTGETGPLNLSNLLGQVTVPAGQTYVGDIDLVAGDVSVDGTLRGGVSMTAGRVAVGAGGRITGPVQIGTGLVQVAPGGAIQGTVQVGPRSESNLICPASVGAGCSLAGDSHKSFTLPSLRIPIAGLTRRVVVTRRVTPGIRGALIRRLFGLGAAASAWAIGVRLLTWLGLLALALPVAAIWPAAVGGVRRQILRDPGRSALVGLLAVILAVPVLLAVSITIVGIPVAFAAALGLVAAWFCGYVAVIALVGARTAALARGGEDAAPLWSIVIGSAILAAIGWVPVLGGLVAFAVACVGIGAVLLSRFGTDRPWLPPRRNAEPPPAAPVPPSGPEE